MKKPYRILNIHEDYRGIEGAESLMHAANEMLKPFKLKLRLEEPDQEKYPSGSDDDEEYEIESQIVTLTSL